MSLAVAEVSGLRSKLRYNYYPTWCCGGRRPPLRIAHPFDPLSTHSSRNPLNPLLISTHPNIRLIRLIHCQPTQAEIRIFRVTLTSRTAALSTPSAVSCATQPRAADSASRLSPPSCRVPPHSRCPPPRAQPRAAVGNDCRR